MHTIIKIKEEVFDVLMHENQYLFHPVLLNHGSLEKSKLLEPKELNIELVSYKLILKHMRVESDEELPTIQGVVPDRELELSNIGTYHDLDLDMKYTGAILMANTLVNTYGDEPDQAGNYPCYCYKVVYEYVFEQGILVTTIDHSRAMLRIRKNLDLGYRSLDKKRDYRCIRRFIKASLIGRYKSTKKYEKYNHNFQAICEQYKDIVVEYEK